MQTDSASIRIEIAKIPEGIKNPFHHESNAYQHFFDISLQTVKTNGDGDLLLAHQQTPILKPFAVGKQCDFNFMQRILAGYLHKQ